MNTKYKIKFTAHAQKDLDRIFSYISSDLYSPQSAKRIMKKIDDSISNLANYPFLAPLIDDEFLARKGLRKLVSDDYIIIYKVLKTDIIIYRVFNGRTDYIKSLR